MHAKRLLIGAGALLMGASVAAGLAMHFLSSTVLSFPPHAVATAAPQMAATPGAVPKPRRAMRPRATVREKTVGAVSIHFPTNVAPRVTIAPRATIAPRITVAPRVTVVPRATTAPRSMVAPLDVGTKPVRMDCEAIELTQSSAVPKRIVPRGPPLPC